MAIAKAEPEATSTAQSTAVPKLDMSMVGMDDPDDATSRRASEPAARAIVQPMRRLRALVSCLCFFPVAFGLSACGAASSQQIPQGSKVPNASAGDAIANAVAAGVIWATGGGCKLQGCPYGSYCSYDTGFCQTRKCSEGCPLNTVCNEGLDRCQVASPARPPSDYLPTDNKLLTPPTVH